MCYILYTIQVIIYMVQRSNPPPPWTWVSHSTVPLPPVVWWGCGTVHPLPPCGVVGVWLFIYCIYIYLCM